MMVHLEVNSTIGASQNDIFACMEIERKDENIYDSSLAAESRASTVVFCCPHN